MKRIKRSNWLLYFLILVFSEGIIALAFLFSIKSESVSVVFWGLSKQRLLIVLPFGLIISLVGILIFRLLRVEKSHQKANRIFQKFIDNNMGYFSALFFCFSVLFYVFWIISTSTNTVYTAYFNRLEPLLWYLEIVCLEIIFFVRIFRFGIEFKSLRKQVPKSFLAILFLTILIVLFVIVTRIGIEPDKYQWRGPGVPILAWHVLFSVLLGFIVIKLGGYIFSKVRRSKGFKWITISKFDLMIALLIWGTAFFLWRAEPLHTNYFNPGIPPPNYEFYPYSDASGYDISAYHLLVGNGFETNVRRPLLSAFLAIGHGLLDYSYDAIVDWQLIFYSFFPVILYLLVTKMHNRVSGLMIASLAVFREVTALKLSGVAYVSNTKMIMSDFPAMLGTVIIVFLVSKWLENKNSSNIWLLITGSVVGLTMLIRLQVTILIFAILAFILIKLSFHLKSVFRSSGILILGILVAIVPWLTRNYFVSGSFNFTDFSNTSQGGLLDVRYQPNMTEESTEYDSTLEFIFENPNEVTRFVSAHFFHNQIDTLLILPLSTSLAKNNDLFIDTQEYLDSPQKLFNNLFSANNYIYSMPYWPEWQDEFSSQSYIPMGVNLMLIVLGISVTWKRNRLAGVFPLFAFFTYIFGIALFRISGWRFLMPVDWVGYLYFGIGLVQLILWISAYFNNELFENDSFGVSELLLSKRTEELLARRWIFIVVAFFLLSASIPLAEKLIPQRYGQGDLQLIIEKNSDQLIINNDMFELNEFLIQENAVIYQGLALYPRFDFAGEGHLNSQWESHVIRDFSRLGFLLLAGSENVVQVVLPIKQSPDLLLNGSDVVVLACSKEEYVVANAVIYSNDEDQEILFSDNPVWNCP